MAEITLASIDRVMKKAGVSRISNSGKEILRQLLESYGGEIASRAVAFAKHAKRKTVRAEDVSLAIT